MSRPRSFVAGRRAGLPATGARPRNLLKAIEQAPAVLPGLEKRNSKGQIVFTSMSEAVLLKNVRDILKDLGLGLLWYHPNLSIRDERGFPDLTILGSKLLFRELKTEKGPVRPEQKVWIERLTAAGEDAGIWRPSDLASGRIAQELAALGKRKK